MQPGASEMSCYTTLRRNGLKLTPQRRLIIDIIHEADDHVTAEDIIIHVTKKMPGVNKSTIYRTLDLLEKTGCVYKSGSREGSIYHHAEEGMHHHLVCSVCGKTIICDEGLFSSLESNLEERYGFEINFKHLVINGLCSECRGMGR